MIDTDSCHSNDCVKSKERRRYKKLIISSAFIFLLIIPSIMGAFPLDCAYQCSANDLEVTSAQITDQNGIPVILADDEVTCTISGPARLLGLESASNTDMTNYRDNIHRVFNGKMLAYIGAIGAKGKIEIIFSSPWLNSAKITITAE